MDKKEVHSDPRKNKKGFKSVVCSMVNVGIGDGQNETCFEKFWNSRERKELKEKYEQEECIISNKKDKQQFSTRELELLQQNRDMFQRFQNLLEQQSQRPMVHLAPGAVAPGAIASGAVASGGTLVIGVNNNHYHYPTGQAFAPAASSNEQSGNYSI